jgi:hypothetical protein
MNANNLPTDPSRILIKEAIDHAWDWFSLHANQRLQGVNFFLLALAFLSGAYVNALRFNLATVAAGVSALALIFSLGFYMLESRIRELVKAGEAALKPAQRKMAELTGITEFEICQRIEKPKHRITAYSKVFRLLFVATIITSALGVGYAVHLAVPHFQPFGQNPIILLILYRSIIVVAAVAALYLCKRITTVDKAEMNWFHYVVGLGLLGGGIAVLVLSVLRPIK